MAHFDTTIWLELRSLVGAHRWKEVKWGAHVVVRDGGKSYVTWMKKPGCRRRLVASHYWRALKTNITRPQQELPCRLPLPVTEAYLLFGVTEYGGKEATFFQLEKHSERDPHHVVDRLRGGQIGPLGESTRTDRNPIVIERRGR